jgi:hypothetical protein
METLYFTFGILTMVAVIITTVIVFGIVKVIKQSKQINAVNRELYDIRDDLYRGRDELSREVYTVIKDERQELISYVDSRIDKLEAKLTGKSEAQIQLNNKNLIKG